MKSSITTRLLVILTLCLCAPVAFAQTVPATATVGWTLPTLATDGTPLTGGQALTKIQAWASAAPILDTDTSLPTAELPAVNGVVPISWKYATTAANGATLYFRLRACNLGGCSALSPQATKTVVVTVPNAATGITVTVTVTVTSP